MKTIRFISSIAYFLTRALALIYFALTLYMVFVFILHALFPVADWVPIHTYENSQVTEANSQRFEILIPATDKPFLLGRNTAWGIAEIILGMGLYSIFFYLLSCIFNAFRQEKLFTEKAVKTLMQFAKASFILPVSFFLFLYLHPQYDVGGGEIAVMLLHILLGIFALFQAAIFKEGFHLQKEQDLTI